MRVISYVPCPEGKDIPEYIEIVSWEELLQTSDYISLHVPGGEKNQGIISKKEVCHDEEIRFPDSSFQRRRC